MLTSRPFLPQASARRCPDASRCLQIACIEISVPLAEEGTGQVPVTIQQGTLASPLTEKENNLHPTSRITPTTTTTATNRSQGTDVTLSNWQEACGVTSEFSFPATGCSDKSPKDIAADENGGWKSPKADAGGLPMEIEDDGDDALMACSTEHHEPLEEHAPDKDRHLDGKSMEPKKTVCDSIAPPSVLAKDNGSEPAEDAHTPQQTRKIPKVSGTGECVSCEQTNSELPCAGSLDAGRVAGDGEVQQHPPSFEEATQVLGSASLDDRCAVNSRAAGIDGADPGVNATDTVLPHVQEHPSIDACPNQVQAVPLSLGGEQHASKVSKCMGDSTQQQQQHDTWQDKRLSSALASSVRAPAEGGAQECGDGIVLNNSPMTSTQQQESEPSQDSIIPPLRVAGDHSPTHWTPTSPVLLDEILSKDVDPREGPEYSSVDAGRTPTAVAGEQTRDGKDSWEGGEVLRWVTTHSSAQKKAIDVSAVQRGLSTVPCSIYNNPLCCDDLLRGTSSPGSGVEGPE